MRYTFLFVPLMLLATELSGQWMIAMNEDSLHNALKTAKDTTAVRVLLQLAGSYFFKEPATSVRYAKMALDSSRRLKYELGIIESSVYGGEASRLIGDYVGGLKLQYEANELSKQSSHKNAKYWEARSAGGIGMNYYDQERFELSRKYLMRSVTLLKTRSHDEHEPLYNSYLARYYIVTKNYDSAIYYLQQAARYINIKPPRGQTVRWKMVYYIAFGEYWNGFDNQDSAFHYFKTALRIASDSSKVVPNHVALTSIRLADLYSRNNQFDSSLYFSRQALKVAMRGKYNPRIRDASRQLADVYDRMGISDSAYYYLKKASVVNDSLLGSNKIYELLMFQLEQQRRDLAIQQAEERYQSNVRLIVVISITAIVLLASILLFRSNRMKHKTNLVLQQTLSELKATQSQLIQSEKMASLGELTAGIAHEIQNPLNFVNNFSELNKELIDELYLNAKEGKIDAIQKLASDIKENEEKIEHHGKRADAIVKSMLQHSRTSSGKKELTDINALCDEYTRLAYHGYRAKDKSFNATFETNLDPFLPKVNVVSQDVGRVILNLINNAFYAVNEKSKRNGTDYEPIVIVSTKKSNDKIEIRVKDNGTGMGNGVKQKIFQPFYTTKPPGRGTGLGLSLAYDIITKSHGGELKVESVEGKGSEFIILLPLSGNT